MAIELLNVTDVFVVLSCLVVLNYLVRGSRKRAPLPPGPKGFPIIGNVLDMPSGQEWLTFAKWGERYGGISSVNVLGQPIIIINSAQTALEMLDKKSSIYSDRPVLQMAGELIGWKNTLVFVRPGDRFRRYRRMFHEVIGSRTSLKTFWPAQQIETHRFLRRVLADPDDVAAHIRHSAGAIILQISHGYQVKEHNDPFVKLADEATEQFSLASAPGAYLVDVLPALRYLPAWLPGTGFLKTAKEWATTLDRMVEQPYNFVKQQMAAGTAPVSFVSSFLEGKTLTAEEEFEIKWSSASLYAGGADTTVSAIYSFFLAMTLHPEVAKKAQAEIDAVVGDSRFPTFEDRQHLPYVDALAKEVFRFNSVAPTGVPHRTTQDDIHDGYFIPKDSLIFVNIWGLMRDPKMYPNPERFDPERYLPAEGKITQTDPREFTFGFGRRICPGMHLADASVFIACAMSLAVFDITKSVENGVVVEPVRENTSGVISHPKPFKCTIKPRSAKAAALIQAELE